MNRLRGLECPKCQHRTTDLARPLCPNCGNALVGRDFRGTGVVWASTVVRIAIPGFSPPYGLAYVDLDQGPRILARYDMVDQVLPVGSRVVVEDFDESGTARIRPDQEDS